MNRLAEFLATLPDVTPDEFIALDQVDGLVEFQDDIALIIGESTNQNSTGCNLDGLQALVDEQLRDLPREGLLQEFLVTTVQTGRQLETADLQVSPGDDVETVLSLLDHGSTLTFAPGTYELERPLLIQRSIALLGAGADETVLRSAAVDAAIVVVGQGELTVRSLSVEHIGDEAASVMLTFARPIDIADVALSGGVSADDGSGGNGIVLSDEVFGATDDETPEIAPSVLTTTTIRDNTGAGIAVSGSLAPVIDRVTVAENDICGVCYFGDAGGELRNSVIESNEVGIQIGDAASPSVSGNEIIESSVAGIVIVGTAEPDVSGNAIAGAAEVGVAVQDSAAPHIIGNDITGVPVGMSVLSVAPVNLASNVIRDIDIGVQVDEGANPELSDNRIEGSRVAGIAIRGDATGSFDGNEISPDDGIGVVVEGTAAPLVEDLTVTGGVVAVAYTGDAAGRMSNSRFSDQEIGIQLDERAAPELSGIEVNGATSAGFVARGSTTARIVSSMFADSVEVGFAIIDDAAPTIEGNTFRGGPSGGSALGRSTPLVRANDFADLDVGMQIGETARPTIEDNEFDGMLSAALVYVGDGAGVASGNAIRDPGIIGIQLGENASPTLTDNVFFIAPPDPGSEPEPDIEPESATGTDDTSVDPAEVAIDATVGILYAGDTAGTAEGNRMVGFVIGIQVGEDAAPELRGNSIDGGDLVGVGVLYRDRAAGSAVDNETSRHAVGFQLSDQTSPRLEANTVTSARNVAFLVQGEANPTLERNVCPADLAGIGMLDGTTPELIANECTQVFGAESET